MRWCNLKLFSNWIEDVSFSLHFERDTDVCVGVCVCLSVCVCDTVCPLKGGKKKKKNNGLGFQQKQQLMIKRFYCQAVCRVTIIMLRSFEQPETLLLIRVCVAAGSKSLWHLIFKTEEVSRVDTRYETGVSVEVWLLNLLFLQ